MAKKKRGGRKNYHSPLANAKYVTLRSHHSSTFRMDEVLDLMLRTHLEEEYGNDPETIALLKLTGYLNALKLRLKFMATKEDYMRFMALAEKERMDKKFGLTKAEASARFLTGKMPNKISQTFRPADYMGNNDRYVPKPGSSKGKLGTKQRGAVKTEKQLRKLFEAIFKLGEKHGKKGKTKMPKFDVSRTFKL